MTEEKDERPIKYILTWRLTSVADEKNSYGSRVDVKDGSSVINMTNAIADQMRDTVSILAVRGSLQDGTLHEARVLEENIGKRNRWMGYTGLTDEEAQDRLNSIVDSLSKAELELVGCEYTNGIFYPNGRNTDGDMEIHTNVTPDAAVMKKLAKPDLEIVDNKD